MLQFFTVVSLLYTAHAYYEAMRDRRSVWWGNGFAALSLVGVWMLVP